MMKHQLGIGLHNVTLVRTPGLEYKDPIFHSYRPRLSPEAKISINIICAMSEEPKIVNDITKIIGGSFQTIYKCLIILNNRGLVRYDGKDRYTRNWSLTRLGLSEQRYWLSKAPADAGLSSKT
jgi:hypothetical protein